MARIDLHVYIHGSGTCQSDNTDAILNALSELKGLITAMSAELDRLTASVADETTVTDSLITLVTGLADQLRAHANDPAQINALADSLDATKAKVAAAVQANTPTSPATPPIVS